MCAYVCIQTTQGGSMMRTPYITMLSAYVQDTNAIRVVIYSIDQLSKCLLNIDVFEIFLK